MEGACALVAAALGPAGEGDLEAREAALSFFRECLLSDRDLVREKSEEPLQQSGGEGAEAAGDEEEGVLARLREAAAGEDREDEIELAREALGMLLA